MNCPTLTLEAATDRTWDVAVVGAGPAGALAARQLAARDREVLLIDKAAFPRRKVCGCCLNAAALAALNTVGLGKLPDQHGAVPLRWLALASRRRRALIPLPRGASLSREVFDTALIQCAVNAGAAFVPKTRAVLRLIRGGPHQLTLHHDGRLVVVESRVVVAADGLGGRLLDGYAELTLRAAPGSRIGAGAIVEAAPSAYAAGSIFMACGQGGYVGLVRLEDGRLNVAAALDRGFVQRVGGPSAAASRLLEEAAMPAISGIEQAKWRGTPALTCARAHIGAERLFVVGDAAGYVEPFTGEGIAWALASSVAAAPLADQAVDRWDDALAARWECEHRRLIGRRRQLCRLITATLRRAALTRGMVGVLSRAPALAGPIVRRVNAPVPLAPAAGSP